MCCDKCQAKTTVDVYRSLSSSKPLWEALEAKFCHGAMVWLQDGQWPFGSGTGVDV